MSEMPPYDLICTTEVQSCMKILTGTKDALKEAYLADSMSNPWTPPLPIRSNAVHPSEYLSDCQSDLFARSPHSREMNGGISPSFFRFPAWHGK